MIWLRMQNHYLINFSSVLEVQRCKIAKLQLQAIKTYNEQCNNIVLKLCKLRDNPFAKLFVSACIGGKIITVHPRLSKQVELIFLLGRSDMPKIRLIENQNFPTVLAMKFIVTTQNSSGVLKPNWKLKSFGRQKYRRQH